MLLGPLSALYGAAIAARNWLYDNRRLASFKVNIPVICVGNVTAGGNGKTPLTICIAEQLSQGGKLPVVLSRGYGGRISGPHVVQASDQSGDVGDEPLMMARNHGLKVVIAKDRVRGAQFIEQQKLGDIIVLDDGLQHRRLERDLNILCADISTEQGIAELLSGELLPLGRLREDLRGALRRVHIVALNHRGPKRSEMSLRVKQQLGFSGEYIETWITSGDFFSLTGSQTEIPASAVVVCGLGHPAGFIASVKAAGCNVIAEHLFADHHRIAAVEIERIKEAHPDVPLVISSKDRVRLSDAEWGTGVLEFRGQLQVEPAGWTNKLADRLVG